ncbi:MAG TPA: glycosyltransferase [Allosphingosinicella sp.]|nr:glycosyltransferase [Allosphingosinicella sp.]
MVRLLKLGIYDPAYLDGFYRQRSGLAEASYGAQHRALIEDRAASSDFWTAALARIGYETADVIANAAPLQRRWALENAPVAGRNGDPFGISIAQARSFAPDVVLVADYSTFSPDFLRALRAECPSIKRIVGWCGAPYRDLSVIREWDLALSCVPELVAGLRAGGIAAHHVNHGFDPRILGQLVDVPSPTPFSFLGSVVRSAGFHEEREKLLAHLLERTPLQIWSSAARRTGPAGRARQFARRLLRRGPPPLDPLIARRAQPPLFGLAMFRKLRESSVTLNTHIDISARSASNMRLFEATGAGACLLTDRKDNLADLFEPDREVVTYGSPEEAVEKYRFLADHPAERTGIAAAGQRRALRDHGFESRAARIDEILRASLKAA